MCGFPGASSDLAASLEGRQGSLSVEGARVATAAVPAAARTALEVLEAGGNAYDAAVAAALVETVWLPMKCGLGGDLVALCRTPGGGFRSLIAIGGGAAALDRGARLELAGPKSVGAPAAPAGYAALAAEGRLGLAALAAPAIAMAEAGVTWLPVAVDLTGEAEAKLRRYSGPNRFLPGGRLPETGAPLQLPGLARVLAAFAEDGEALFHGALGQQVVERVTRDGGFLSHDDLRAARADWLDPEEAALSGGATLLATPLPTHGPLLLEAYRRAEKGGVVEYKAFMAALAAVDAPLGDAGTSVVSAADGEGNAVMLVHSNSFPQYGSCVLLEEQDLILNNRPGRGFDLTAASDHWNAPQAGRRPFTTLHAWALRDQGGDWLGATPGGRNQVPWNLQTLRRLRENGGRAEEALMAPKWGFDRSGTLVREAGVEAADGGIGFREIPPLSLRSAEQLIHLPRGSARRLGAADPRTGAVALAQ